MVGDCGRTNNSIMERHHQHTSPFPPEFRTTHNFFTKEVFVSLSTQPFLKQMVGELMLFFSVDQKTVPLAEYLGQYPAAILCDYH